MDAKDYGWHEFHRNRKIIIKDVPPVTYKDVREYLGPIQASDIVISKRHKHVIVTLTHGDQAENIAGTLAMQPLLGKAVSVALYPKRMMLCILGVPLQLSDAQFKRFAEQFGPVEVCFLVRGSIGMSKGYGLVEYAHNRLTTDKVRSLITNASFASADGACRRPMSCDYLPENVLRYDELHSRTVVFLEQRGSADHSSALQLAVGAGNLHPVAVSRGTMAGHGRAANFSLGFVAATYASVLEAERAWSQAGGVHVRDLPACSFSMPGTDAAETARRLSDPGQPLVHPVGGGRTTAEEAVKRFGAIFPGKTELIRAFEKFLSKVVESLNGEPLTDQAVETILTLVAKPDAEVSHYIKNNMKQTGPPDNELPSMARPNSTASRSFASRRTPPSQVPSGTLLPTMIQNENVTARLPPCDSPVNMFHSLQTRPFAELQLSANNVNATRQAALDLFVPGCGYEAHPSLTGPVTRSRGHSAGAGVFPSPVPNTLPYGRPGSEKLQEPSDRHITFEASLEEALSYVASHKKQLTPRALRAAARLLPDPEPSPEGHYIGQHSQGIGGHYAESYWAKKKQRQLGDEEFDGNTASPCLRKDFFQQPYC